MSNVEELISLLDSSEKSREKTLVIFMCASESLTLILNNGQENQVSDLVEVLESVEFLTKNWLDKLINETITESQFMEIYKESNLLNRMVRIYFDGYTEKIKQLHVIDDILQSLFQNININNYDPKLFILFFAVEAKKFHDCHSGKKFEIANSLCGAIRNNLFDCRLKSSVQNSIFLITKGLLDILGSRLNNTYRNIALRLVAIITDVYSDLRWISFKNEEHPENVQKMFLLLGSLVPIELRLCLDNPEVNSDVLASNLTIMEAILITLANYQEDEEDTILTHLTASEAAAVLENTEKAMLTVVEFLLQRPPKKDQVNACTRLLCLYVTIEAELLQQKFDDIVMLLLDILESCEEDQLAQILLRALYSIGLVSPVVHKSLLERTSVWRNESRPSEYVELANQLLTILTES